MRTARVLAIAAFIVACAAVTVFATPVVMDMSGGAQFRGDVTTKSGATIAAGTVTYPSGARLIGTFQDGVPEGLLTYYRPDREAWLLDFRAGKLVRVYRAENIQPYQVQVIQPYQAGTIPVFQSQTIQQYQAGTIQQYQAGTIEVVQAQTITPYQAETVKSFQGLTIEAYVSSAVDPHKAQELEKYTSAVVQYVHATPVQPIDPAVTVKSYEAKLAELTPPAAAIQPVPPAEPVKASTPDYSNPLVQQWTSYMISLPFLIYGGW